MDKDIIEIGNKLYSPNKCVFVTLAINGILAKNEKIRGELPMGVVYDKRNGRFCARCKVKGKVKHIGGFDTANKASNAYLEFKYKHLVATANKQTDSRVREGLLRHAELIL